MIPVRGWILCGECSWSSVQLWWLFTVEISLNTKEAEEHSENTMTTPVNVSASFFAYTGTKNSRAINFLHADTSFKNKYLDLTIYLLILQGAKSWCPWPYIYEGLIRCCSVLPFLPPASACSAICILRNVQVS